MSIEQQEQSHIDSEAEAAAPGSMPTAPNLSMANEIFSQADLAEGVRAPQAWQFASQQQALLDLLQQIWGVKKNLSLEASESKAAASTHEMLPAQGLRAYAWRQRLGLILQAPTALPPIDKALMGLSMAQIEKFLLTLGIHLRNQTLLIVSKQYRTQLQRYFSENELNKVLYFWPCKPSTQPLNDLPESCIDPLKRIGFAGAERLFEESMLWKLKREEHLCDPPFSNASSLGQKLEQARWLKTSYFFNFLRWFI